jgi:hypothetical protein
MGESMDEMKTRLSNRYSAATASIQSACAALNITGS